MAPKKQAPAKKLDECADCDLQGEILLTELATVAMLDTEVVLIAIAKISKKMQKKSFSSLMGSLQVNQATLMEYKTCFGSGGNGKQPRWKDIPVGATGKPAEGS